MNLLPHGFLAKDAAFSFKHQGDDCRDAPLLYVKAHAAVGHQIEQGLGRLGRLVHPSTILGKSIQ